MRPAVVLAVLSFLVLSGCSSLWDLGKVDPAPVRDGIHDWVGQEAAIRGGAPISAYNLTDDEHTLRDLAFPLIEPPYDRQRWDAVVYEWGDKHSFQHALWNYNPTLYYQKLQPALRAYLTKLREEAYIFYSPGFVDTGASPNQTQPVITAAPKENDAKKLGKKKKKKLGFL